MNISESFANIIWLFHLLVILFVILAPFTKIPAILILHITFSVCLLVHWAANSNICSLTVIESYFRGLPPSDTFMHQLISPMYDISSTDLNEIVHIVTYITMFISIYYLYKSEKFQECLICYNKLTKDQVTFGKVLECIQPLFIF
jgi:hypothetical protein